MPLRTELIRCCRALAAALALAARSAGAQAPSPVTPVDLPVGRSLPIQTAVAVTRVSIAQPEVADVVVISERELVVNSIKPGETDAIVWLNDGSRTHYRISVHSPADRMQLSIGVKFAEVRKDALRQLGAAGYYRDHGTRVGTGVLGNDGLFDKETGAITIPGGTRYLTVLSDFGTDKLLGFLEAEEQRGHARLLAEPTILAGNKDTASFLAGGELPIPVLQPNQGGGSQVSIQYREFGIRLGFKGEILNDSLIKLAVTPEVSSLDYANALLLQGFRIPAFRTRRVSTTVDVRNAQSLVISGLFAGEEERIRSGIPFLKDIPILGELFSSSRFQRNESELIVVVTLQVVNPNRLREVDQLRFAPDSTRPAVDALRKRLPKP